MQFIPRPQGTPLPNQNPFMPRQMNFGRSFGNPNMLGNMAQTPGPRSGLISRLLGMGQQSPMGNMYGANPMMNSRGMFPQMLGGAQVPRVGGQGGFLAKLMGSQGGGVIPGVPGVGGGTNIIGMLNNVQKVLGVTQQAMPIIQQYGPMIKNMPALIKMMKAINSQNNENTGETEANTENEITDLDEESNEKISKNSKLNHTKGENDIETADANKEESTKKGISKPKLYI